MEPEKLCKDCLWFDVCWRSGDEPDRGDDPACDGFAPRSLEEQTNTEVDEYLGLAHERGQTYYRAITKEQSDE